MNRSAQGRRAEDIAVRFLKRSGYRVLERNVRCRFGEIDIVAQDGPTICFVEVKSSSTAAFGYPEERISPFKRLRLLRLAEWYLQRRLRAEHPVRFDVVSLLLAPGDSAIRMRLLKGAFTRDA